MSSRITIVSLTGGLGNQLFQFAEALAADPDRVYILASLGMPRITDGKPDLLHFALPENSMFLERKEAPKFIKKVGGYMLRKGIERRGIERNWFINSVLNLALHLLAICLTGTQISPLPVGLNLAPPYAIIGF